LKVKDEGGSSINALLLIIVSVSIAVVAQLVLKLGVEGIGQVNLGNWESIRHFLLAAVSSPQVLLGLALYGLSAVIWLVVLARVNLSYAYPMVATSYVLMLILSRFLLKEDVSLTRWIGVAIICLGVLIMSRS
jgi:drug/metabolite transporter (DMT)-like permease